VTRANPSALVLRTTIYGWNAVDKQSLAEWFLAKLETGEAVAGFIDAWFTPINTAHLVEAILDLFASPGWPTSQAVGGVLHLGGGESITKFEFGQAVATTFGLDPRAIQPIRIADHVFAARRSGWACLDSSRAASILHRPPPTIKAGLSRLRLDRETGRRAELRRMGGTE
jgi:dTDP-4-dehydrorhamnose reductase